MLRSHRLFTLVHFVKRQHDTAPNNALLLRSHAFARGAINCALIEIRSPLNRQPRTKIEVNFALVWLAPIVFQRQQCVNVIGKKRRESIGSAIVASQYKYIVIDNLVVNP